MAFSKGDEVFVTSGSKQHRAVVRSVTGPDLVVAIGLAVAPAKEADCVLVPVEDRKLVKPSPSPSGDPLTIPEGGCLESFQRQEAKDAATTKRAALKTKADAVNARTPPS